MGDIYMNDNDEIDNNKSSQCPKQISKQVNRQQDFIKIAIKDISRLRQLTDDTIKPFSIVRCEQLSNTIEEYRDVLFCYLFEYYVVKTFGNDLLTLNNKINALCDDVMRTLIVPMDKVQDL